MSSLAFDKQGKPFTFHRRAKKLLVRLFRNPSARGTCCQVLDGEGQPLYIDPETDYAEFRKAIGQVPGLYRLDQCDDDGNELNDAQAAYVSIDVARNAHPADGGAIELSPLVIIQQMAAQQAEVMKTMAQEQAKLLAASADILRAPYRPAPVAFALPGADLRNADAIRADLAERNDGDDEGADEELNAAAPEHPMTAALRMLEPYLPHIGSMAYQKVTELFRELNGRKSTATSAAVPAPVPAACVSSSPVGAAPVSGSPIAAEPTVVQAPMPIAVNANASVSASPSVAAPAMEAPDATNSNVPTSPTIAGASGTETTCVPSPLAAGRSSLITPPAPAAAPPGMPTPAQLMHLHAIRAGLSDRERAIAERVITRMDASLRAQYLAELSAMSVEDATDVIRDLVTQVTT